MEFDRRRRPFRYLGKIVDGVNVILSLSVVVCAVLIILDTASNMLLFPVIFFCTALMNMTLAIKYYKRKETGKTIMLILGFILFMAIGIASLVIVL